MYKRRCIDAARMRRTLDTEAGAARARVTGATTGAPQQGRPSLAADNEPVACAVACSVDVDAMPFSASAAASLRTCASPAFCAHGWVPRTATTAVGGTALGPSARTGGSPGVF